MYILNGSLYVLHSVFIHTAELEVICFHEEELKASFQIIHNFEIDNIC